MDAKQAVTTFVREALPLLPVEHITDAQKDAFLAVETFEQAKALIYANGSDDQVHDAPVLQDVCDLASVAVYWAPVGRQDKVAKWLRTAAEKMERHLPGHHRNRLTEVLQAIGGAA